MSYPHHHHGHHLHGNFVIINAATGTALDSNVGAAAQISGAHPRPFMWQPVPHAPNHQWELHHVEGDWYTIVAKGTNKALDGNISVPQVDISHPAPFLWETTPQAFNHQWRFDKVDHETYIIINRANGKALDGNVGGARQHVHTHPAPFLWDPVPSARNHQWRLQRL